MRILILGSGMMGPAAARFLLADPQVGQVTLGDRQLERLREAEARLAETDGGRFATAVADVTDREAAARLLAGFDVVLCALPQAASPAAIRAAAAAGVPVVDLVWPPAALLPELRRLTAAAETMFLPGCGVDPGLTEILAARLAERLDGVTELHLKCGGIPQQPAPPLGYKIVFGGCRLPLRPEPASAVEEGVPVAVPRYSGVETLHFPGVGEVEAYHEGLAPTLLELPALREVRRATQKTIRWPGYAAKALLLCELGLLGEEPVAVDGRPVSPKNLLDALLAPRLRLAEGEGDLVLLQVEARGESGGWPRCRRAQAVVRPDPGGGLTAMARVTAGTAAAVVRMVGRGELRGQGLVPPEQAVTGEHCTRLLADLAEIGIHFELTEEQSGPLT